MTVLDFDLETQFLIVTFLKLRCTHTPKWKSATRICFKLSSSQHERTNRGQFQDKEKKNDVFASVCASVKKVPQQLVDKF